MAIADNRTLLSTFQTGDTVTTPDDLGGTPVSTSDAEIFIKGSRSWGWYTTTTRDGLLYDHGSAQDWSDNTFYFWTNCGVVGLLDTLANGGMAARFCGATVTDWFEVDLAGSNIYPVAFQGGWVMFVIDIELAKTASDRTNGTPPATTAIRYAGITTITSATMPRMVSNTWLNGVWRLPNGTPGITVEAQNTGSVDWTWQDVIDAADVTDPTKAWGTIKLLPNGTVALSCKVRVGADDTVTHGFSDTGVAVGFEDWQVVDDIGTGEAFYGIEVYGNAGGTTNFQLGDVSGTGDDQTGSNGGSIGTGGPAFDINLIGIDNNDLAALYGVSITGCQTFTCDGAEAEVISCGLTGGTLALIADAGEFLRNVIVGALNGDGVGYCETNDISDAVFCTFNFSDGHAFEITTPNTSTQASKGNVFLGYGADGTNDAAVYNNSGAGLVTINVTDGGSDITTREGASASTLIVLNPVTLTITVLDGVAKTAIENIIVRVWASGTGPFPSSDPVSITRSGAVATVDHTAHGLETGDIVRIEGVALSDDEYNGFHAITVTGVNDYTYAVAGTPTTPAPGTPLSSLVLISGLTNASGVIADTRTYSADQDVTGTAMKGTSLPVYVPGDVAGTVDSGVGVGLTVLLAGD